MEYCGMYPVQFSSLACNDTCVQGRELVVAGAMVMQVHYSEMGPASPLQPPVQHQLGTVAQPATVQVEVPGSQALAVMDSRPSTAASSVPAAYYMQVLSLWRILD